MNRHLTLLKLLHLAGLRKRADKLAAAWADPGQINRYGFQRHDAGRTYPWWAKAIDDRRSQLHLSRHKVAASS